MHRSDIQYPTPLIKHYFPVYTGVLIFGYLVCFIFFSFAWGSYNHLIHSGIEIFNISLMLFTFIHVWNTYSEAYSFVKWVGFLALVSVFINLPHIINFTDLLISSGPVVNYLVDISLKYGVFIAFFEIVLWLLSAHFHNKLIIGRKVGLAITLSSSLILYVVLIKLVDFLPLFYNQLSITMVKNYADMVLSMVAAAVMAVYIVNFHKSCDEREKVMYGYIILALAFFIPSRVFFALSLEVTSPMQFMGHVLKLSYYYSIYHGVYKTIIEYPYMQVRRVKDFYENILDTAPLGIITFDKEDRLSYANKQCNNFFRYDIRSLYNATIEKFLDTLMLHECEKTELMNKLNMLGEGKFDFYGLPVVSDDKSSKLIFTALRLNIGTALVVRDAKKAQAIENMQLQTQTLLDSAENIILLIDINKKVVMCNRKFLELIKTGTSKVVGMDVIEMAKMLQLDMNGTTYEEIYNKDVIHGSRWSIRTMEGEIKRISLDCSPIHNMDNEKIGWIIMGRDDSEYEKEQEKIIHSEKMAIIGQMAAGLVHEIKNPLASIKGLCQLMLNRIKPEKIAEYAAVMEGAVDDIGEIVNGFLQFSKPTTGDYEEASINSLVNSLEMMISTNAYKRGVKTHFYYHDTEKPVIISSQQIKNAILGMVDNALDAMNGALDPILIISTKYEKESDMMCISIKDNGIGMTEEQLECIGTPFYTTKPKGTGLGVSVLKYIVNEHGGSLKIESKFGEGAVFKIMLPCAAEK